LENKVTRDKSNSTWKLIFAVEMQEKLLRINSFCPEFQNGDTD